MKRAQLLILILFTGLWLVCPAPAEYVPEWPVYNGDFSTFSLHGEEDGTFLETGDPRKYDRFKNQCLPAGWFPETISGKHLFKKGEGAMPLMPLPIHIFSKFNQPSSAVIETVDAGRGCFVQDVPLLPGKYRLQVEVQGQSGSLAEVVFVGDGGEKTSSGIFRLQGSWEKLGFGVSCSGTSASIRLCSESHPGNSVLYRNVILTAKSLVSSGIPFRDQTQLGGILLAPEPTPAEAFAAYELQRVIYAMTGLIPGIKGRDPIHHGLLLRLGKAVPPIRRGPLKGLPNSSYLIAREEESIDIAGTSDEGTLYAVYDFLKQQGCRWVVPGAEGEIIPQRRVLLPISDRLENPDYDVRGVEAMAQDYFLRPGGERGWVAINLDDYFDWAMRNRMNGIRFQGIKSYDFGVHRGHGWPQLSNHSYNDTIAPHRLYFEEHPDWYPLVDGKRMPQCHLPPGFPNQLCVSNQGLRDYTVELVLEYFKQNPSAKAFPLVPMDGPSLWCECSDCKALDPPGIDWSRHKSEGHVEEMTDRSLDYANEISSRVSEVCPDKRILVQAYGYTLKPPRREKLHPNILVRYANLSGARGRGPLGVSMAKENPIWDVWRNQLDGWSEAGARITYYNYMDFWHPDASLFWFYSTSDMIRCLHRFYNCRAWFGETEPNKRVSFMLYHVMAETLWDVDAEYMAIVRDLCDHYYGGVSDAMYDYTVSMEKAIRESLLWQEEGWSPIYHQDIPMNLLQEKRLQLREMAAQIGDDPVLARRIAYARLGHAQIIFVQTQKTKTPSKKSRAISREAFEETNALRAEYNLVIKRLSADRLGSFSYPKISAEE